MQFTVKTHEVITLYLYCLLSYCAEYGGQQAVCKVEVESAFNFGKISSIAFLHPRWLSALRTTTE